MLRTDPLMRPSHNQIRLRLADTQIKRERKSLNESKWSSYLYENFETRENLLQSREFEIPVTLSRQFHEQGSGEDRS